MLAHSRFFIKLSSHCLPLPFSTPLPSHLSLPCLSSSLLPFPPSLYYLYFRFLSSLLSISPYSFHSCLLPSSSFPFHPPSISRPCSLCNEHSSLSFGFICVHTWTQQALFSQVLITLVKKFSHAVNTKSLLPGNPNHCHLLKAKVQF